MCHVLYRDHVHVGCGMLGGEEEIGIVRVGWVASHFMQARVICQQALRPRRRGLCNLLSSPDLFRPALPASQPNCLFAFSPHTTASYQVRLSCDLRPADQRLDTGWCRINHSSYTARHPQPPANCDSALHSTAQHTRRTPNHSTTLAHETRRSDVTAVSATLARSLALALSDCPTNDCPRREPSVFPSPTTPSFFSRLLLLPTSYYCSSTSLIPSFSTLTLTLTLTRQPRLDNPTYSLSRH